MQQKEVNELKNDSEEWSDSNYSIMNMCDKNLEKWKY